MKKPKILLVNPPIYDFAAYDFWIKPLGLLKIARILKSKGIPFLFFDFLDRFNPEFPSPPSKDPYGRGKFFTKIIEKPDFLRWIPRRYRRYGAPLEIFYEKVKEFGEPDFVLITTGMSYWYKGVEEITDFISKTFPGAEIILGGIYASLLPKHADSLRGVSRVFRGNTISSLMNHLEIEINGDTSPLWEVYPSLSYGVIRITEGCPYRCTYCAVHCLSSEFRPLSPDEVLNTLNFFKGRGVRDIVFYDDALLFKREEILFPFLERIKALNFKFRFHTPNALHARFIDRDTAIMLKKSGFETIFLGFETVNEERQMKTGGKVSNLHLEEALSNLEEAGYERGKVTVYVMMGLPGQPAEEVEDSLRYVNRLGARVMLSEFSPVPGTGEWEKAKKYFPFYDPLFENNTVFPMLQYDLKTIEYLKNLARELNRTLLQ
jgi:radical SAM superfamily enzyme YgiQ (UPF0313 family)